MGPSDLSSSACSPELCGRLREFGLSRSVMKRCFMTGKQCIFRDAVEVPERRDGGQGAAPQGCHGLKAFIIIPFSANLKTFDHWSLRPYLINGHGFQTETVEGADEGHAYSLPVSAEPLIASGSFLVIERWFRHAPAEATPQR